MTDERTKAAEDADTISRWLRELAAERQALLDCTCEAVIGEHGEIVKIRSPACPVHRETDGGCYLVAPHKVC